MKPAHIFKFYKFLLLTLCFGLLPQNIWGQESVRIGFNYSKTGPYSIEGLDQLRAVKMAVEEINANGGIIRHKIDVIIRDSASSVKNTEENVRNLIVTDKVKMILGGSSSAVAITTSRICQELNIPFFGTLTYSTATTGVDGHRVGFRECYNSWMGVKVMADYLSSHYKNKTYYYITADYTWGWTTEESFRRFTGTGDTSVHQGVLTPLGNTDFIDILRHVKRIRPDVLVLVLFGKDMMNCIRQATVMGIKAACQVVVPNLTLGMAISAGPKAMEGVLGAVPWTWRVPQTYGFKNGIRFVKNYTRIYRSYPSSSAASAYTILYEYKAAVERAGSFQTSKVVKALENHEYQHLKGPQVWRGFDHQSIQTVFMVRCKSATEVLKDPYHQDFFEIIHSIPGDKAAKTFQEWKNDRARANKPTMLERFKGE